MKHYSDEEIIEGILLKDNTILQFIYDKFYAQIEFFVKENSGTDDDAQDIFQDATIIIYSKLKNNSLELSSSFISYLFAVCKLLWLKQLRNRRKFKFKIEFKEESMEIDEDIIEEKTITERYKLYQLYFKELGDDCQKVLQMFLKKIPLKEIADEMGYKNEKYAKKRKYKCKEILLNKIKSDPNFKNLER
ncbi:MAG: sigma-70 family RNA polymerase sigma factor [Saprospiraceae bacterium]|nr:sigma-70 family RNA polymerase sigma factor [Saprospiraceae bacterium]